MDRAVGTQPYSGGPLAFTGNSPHQPLIGRQISRDAESKGSLWKAFLVQNCLQHGRQCRD